MSLAVVIHAPRDLRLEETEVPALGPKDVEVRIGVGGICGSDLHYYQDGGFGTIRIKEPMVLGHEIAGTVTAVGTLVEKVRPGDKVAVNPSRPCNACRYCLQGLPRHCLNMLFYGSAMRFPHVQGGFRQRLVAEERQCVKVPADLPLEKAVADAPLALARKIGADEAVNVATNGEMMKRFHADKGTFDVMFEASGNPAAL